MPSLVKLLDAAGAGITGTTFKNGMGHFPYTIYTQGGYGGTGPTIQVSHDGSEWFNAFGMLGGENVTEASTTVVELKEIPNKSIATINEHHTFIRATSHASQTGSATVYVEHVR